MLDNLFTNILGIAILLYMALAIYMKNRGATLSDIIGELKEGMRK